MCWTHDSGSAIVFQLFSDSQVIHRIYLSGLCSAQCAAAPDYIWMT